MPNRKVLDKTETPFISWYFVIYINFIFNWLVPLILVSTCPKNKRTWMERTQKFNCRYGTYHCGITKHGLMELCLQPRIVPLKYCPSFEAFDINSTIVVKLWNCTHNTPVMSEQCNHEQLPENDFRTNLLYKYPVCFIGQELKTFSTKESSSTVQSTQVSNASMNFRTPSVDINASTSVFMNNEQTLMKDYNDSTPPVLTETGIAIISAIVVFLIVGFATNSVVFCVINRKKKQTFTTSVLQIAERISDTEVEGEIHHADMYEYIDETALQSVVIEKNENMKVDNNDDNFNSDIPYDHLNSNRVIAMEDVNHACSEL